jgi:monoterpene epsilon-lactone hydrolase
MQSVELQELNNLYLSISERTRSDPRPDLWMMRGMFEELVTVGREPEDVTYAEVDVNGIHGLWCRPIGAPSDRVILYFHGGAFVGGSSASHRKLTGHLAKASGVQALSIDYRLAPENTFPAQLDDAVTAFRWLREQGFAAQHIVTAGDSAGGNLSITTALKLKDLGEDLPGAIISLSPWLDMEMQSESLDSNATSDVLINRYGMAEFTHLLLGASGSPTDPLANPLRANLEGLPPVYLAVSGSEVLRDDSVRFADRAREHGVKVELTVESGVQHVYALSAGRAPEADQLIAELARWVRPLIDVN